MNDNIKGTCSGGVGLGTIIWIVLIILRAIGYITMSWFWVITSIIWAPLGIFLVVLLVVGIIIAISAIVAAFVGRKKKK